MDEPTPIVLRDYKHLPLFGSLYILHKKNKQALAISIPAPSQSEPLMMILGKFKADVDSGTFAPDDYDALMRIIEEITLVAKTVLLVKQLEDTTREQVLFLEDMAHDIRTPIQNVVVTAEVLAAGLVPPENIKSLARKIASQVRRLHLTSERIWTLVNIDQGKLQPDEQESVSIYQVVMECRKSLLDIAERRDIQIVIDKELEKWPLIQANKQLFAQAILNLIDNAVKYSRQGKEVRVSGRRLPDGVTLSFVNRGIPIQEYDKDRIFERYYRSKEALEYRSEGTGIGLSIVKAFAEHYGSIKVESLPISGTSDYVTEFKIFIQQRRW